MDMAAIARAFAESGDEFRNQFNRESEEFHNGISVPVPTGGAKIPESMAKGAPTNWQDLPEVQFAIEPEYPPAYHHLMQNYERLNMVKKAMSTLNKPVEACMRARLQYKKAVGDDQDDQTAMLGRMKGEEAIRDGALEACKESLKGCDQSLLSDRTRSCVADVVDRGHFNFEDRDTFGEYMTVLQRCNQAIFADQKKLLQQIKDIKKAAQGAHSKAAVAEMPTTAEAAPAGA